MGITGDIRASRLALEPDVPDRPGSYRLGVTMELVMDSLHIQVSLFAWRYSWTHCRYRWDCTRCSFRHDVH